MNYSYSPPALLIFIDSSESAPASGVRRFAPADRLDTPRLVAGTRWQKRSFIHHQDIRDRMLAGSGRLVSFLVMAGRFYRVQFQVRISHFGPIPGATSVTGYRQECRQERAEYDAKGSAMVRQGNIYRHLCIPDAHIETSVPHPTNSALALRTEDSPRC